MTILEIAVNAPVRQSYSYLLPVDYVETESGSVDMIGKRVLVPFGPRRLTGYVLGCESSDSAAFKLKEVAEILDETPLFHPDIIPLFKWVADYYHYPLGLTIKAALPGGLSVSSFKQISVADSTGLAALLTADPDFQNIDWLDNLLVKGSTSRQESTRIFRSKTYRNTVSRLVSAGLLLQEEKIGREAVSAKSEICYRIEHAQPKQSKKKGSLKKSSGLPGTVIELEPEHSLGKAEQKTVSILEDIAKRTGNFDVPRKELVRIYPYGTQVVQKLQKKNIVKILYSRVYRTPLGELLPHVGEPDHLTSEQNHAIARVTEPIIEKRFETFLLHGVTGSGKTEVYLKAAEVCLKEGRSVLVLVPEIALATQIEAHFVSRFSETVALLHSGLSTGERYDEWSRIYSGTAKIVIGARSAVFAPLVELGLVIVDEEHDGSFKQEDGLRYNGRDVAIVRAKNSAATVILGSATPSVSTYHHALNRKHKLLTMAQRVGDCGLPSVSVIDLKKQTEKIGSGLLHRELLSGLQNTLAGGQQAILLLNRRGFSTSLICTECGAKLECRHCQVTMNFHKKTDKYLCHYCGYNVPAFNQCVNCGAEAIRPIGSGTERIVEEISQLIPEARVERLDSDVSADRKSFLKILQCMGNGEIDILVGTQIIAKGLHFPNVTLVGIVFADGGLAFPDFRAAEKTYQLIAQVTGRAGRGEIPGRVIVQTLQPEHYAIGLAAKHRYERLAEKEIEIRRQVGFPPFLRLAAVRVEDTSEHKARAQARVVSAAARSWCATHDLAKDITVLGPAPAPLEKLRDLFRWQILIKSSKIEPMHALAEHLNVQYMSTGSSRVVIDIDPENML